MHSLPGEIRNRLAAAIKAARRAGEPGARNALGMLAVGDARAHDRLELYSPGGIPNAMTVEGLAHLQSARNEVVTSLLAKCPVPADIPWLRTDRVTLMDKRGEGVRLILDNGERLAGRTPEYRLVDEAELVLTMHGAGAQ